MKKIVNIIFIVLAGTVLVCATAYAQTGAGPMFDTEHYTGWWYDPVETGGNGIALEVQHGNPLGDALYMGWYSYDEAGRPVWYTSGNIMAGEDHYTGTMLEWTGWPLGGPAGEFSSTPVGHVEITFTAPDQAELTWTLDTGATGHKTIRRFMDDFAPGEQDSRGLTGWWMDPEYDGMGIFMEAQGGGLYMAWYHYSDEGYPGGDSGFSWGHMGGPGMFGGGPGMMTGAGIWDGGSTWHGSMPRWWSSGDVFPEGATTFTGELDEWWNGTCLDGPHMAPDSPFHPGHITIEFIDDTHANLTWAGTTLHLQRFMFYNLN